MTLYEFKSLSEEQQTEIVWTEGDFVADRQENNDSILLYQAYSFYIEVAYAGSVNKFQIKRSFSCIEQLDPYLEEIDISSLLI